MDYFKRLKAAWEQKQLQMRFEKALVDEIEQQSIRLYSLEEHRKLDESAIKTLQEEVRKLRVALAGKVSA